MPSFNDLWLWMHEFTASPAFVVALPILIARVFASLVDWLEGYVGASPEADPQRRLDSPARGEHHNLSGVRAGGTTFAPRQAPERF
jgi:hypothetical protein